MIFKFFGAYSNVRTCVTLFRGRYPVINRDNPMKSFEKPEFEQENSGK